jgi:ATP-dependent Clp protease ATP-binding subunit ClpA
MVKGEKTAMNNRDLFDKFTERARKVMNLAQEEAQHYQHNAIGTEHLLLGLVREGESVAAQVLESLGVTLEQVRKAVEEAKGHGNGMAQGEIGLTPHANTAIEMAMKEADRRHPPPSAVTEKRLLGSITMPKSDALKILQDEKLSPHLESLGVTLEQVRKAVEESKGRGVQIVTGMTPPANTASGEADRQHHPLFFIDTANLLLGLMRVPESTAVKVLQGLGVPPLKDFWPLVYLENMTTLQTTNQGYSQRFTRPARKAWSLAHEEARRLQDTYIGAHHLLLGLVGEGSGVAATVLAEMGVKLDEMREYVERMSMGGGDGIAPGDIKLQPYLKDVIELASNEARRLHHPSIGTGHLLLVMARKGEGQGIEVGLLKRQGVDMDKMRTAIWRAFTEKAGSSGQEATPMTDEISEEGLYASYASIASIESDLQSRELDKTILAVYPFAIEARLVLEHARMEARRLDQRVGPEHLLVGLASLTFRHDGPVSKALKDVGIDFARTQAAVENRQGRGAKAAPVVLAQSALCRACLLLAADETEHRDGQGASIKSEHLLLGLLREEKGIIADLLGDLGTSVETVRTKVVEKITLEGL